MSKKEISKGIGKKVDNLKEGLMSIYNLGPDKDTNRDRNFSGKVPSLGMLGMKPRSEAERNDPSIMGQQSVSPSGQPENFYNNDSLFKETAAMSADFVRGLGQGIKGIFAPVELGTGKFDKAKASMQEGVGHLTNTMKTLFGSGGMFASFFAMMGTAGTAISTAAAAFMTTFVKPFIAAVARLALGIIPFLIASTLFVASLIAASLPFLGMALVIGIAVAAVLLGINALFNKFPIIGETLSFIGDVLGDVFGFVYDTISGIVNIIFDVFGNIWGAITDIFGGFIDMFSAAMEGDGPGFLQALKDIGRGILDLILAPFTAIFNGIAGFVTSLLPDWAQNMLGADTGDAEESGLYDKNRIGKSTVDASMISGAPTKDLMAIVSHNDLSEEDMALVKAELDSRNLGLEGTPMTGEELKEQREASKAAMDGGTQNNTAVAQQNTNNNVTNNAFSQSPNPRPTDSTIGRTATVNLN